MENRLSTGNDNVIVTLGNIFALNANGLAIIGNTRPSLDQYEHCFDKPRKMHDCVQFWLGDLYLYIEHDYGDDGFQIFDELDFVRRTITNLARVARSIPLARRCAELTYGHHEVVAALPASEQDFLLEAAVQENLTVQQLRRRVKEFTGEATRPSLGQVLMHLVESWRNDGSKLASECALELEEAVHAYGLMK